MNFDNWRAINIYYCKLTIVYIINCCWNQISLPDLHSIYVVDEKNWKVFGCFVSCWNHRLRCDMRFKGYRFTAIASNIKDTKQSITKSLSTHQNWLNTVFQCHFDQYFFFALLLLWILCNEKNHKSRNCACTQPSTTNTREKYYY